MERRSHCSGECRRHGRRCSLNQLSTTMPAAGAEAAASANHGHHFGGHAVTQTVTSPVTTRVSCDEQNKSQNRGESTHFCGRCLQRRRGLLKKWSRRHREAERSRLSRGDSLALSHHYYNSEQELRPGGNIPTSLFDPWLLDISDYRVKLTGNKPKVDRLVDQCNCMRINERVKSLRHYSSTATACGENKVISRVCFTANVDNVNTGGAETDALLNSFALEDSATDTKSHADCSHPHLDYHGATVSSTTTGGPLIRRLLMDFSAAFSRGIAGDVVNVIRRFLLGRSRDGRRPDHGECERPVTLWGLTPSSRPMTFHRWLLVLLVCVMVLPANSTAAPSFPWQTAVDSPGPQSEPGFKNSFYAVLPPKAEFESVIICLLAVSAFIGLIVWVLKSNFEERQQKRMRREASIRERTSSVPFFKT